MTRFSHLGKGKTNARITANSQLFCDSVNWHAIKNWCLSYLYTRQPQLTSTPKPVHQKKSLNKSPIATTPWSTPPTTPKTSATTTWRSCHWTIAKGWRNFIATTFLNPRHSPCSILSYSCSLHPRKKNRYLIITLKDFRRKIDKCFHGNAKHTLLLQTQALQLPLGPLSKTKSSSYLQQMWEIFDAVAVWARSYEKEFYLIVFRN